MTTYLKCSQCGNRELQYMGNERRFANKDNHGEKWRRVATGYEFFLEDGEHAFEVNVRCSECRNLMVFGTKFLEYV